MTQLESVDLLVVVKGFRCSVFGWLWAVFIADCCLHCSRRTPGSHQDVSVSRCSFRLVCAIVKSLIECEICFVLLLLAVRDDEAWCGAADRWHLVVYLWRIRWYLLPLSCCCLGLSLLILLRVTTTVQVTPGLFRMMRTRGFTPKKNDCGVTRTPVKTLLGFARSLLSMSLPFAFPSLHPLPASM